MRITSWIILAALTIVPIAGAQYAHSQIPQPGNMGRPCSAPAPMPLIQTPDLSFVAVVSVMQNVTESGPVKGMPFTATETESHEQTLADGTTIKSTAEMLLWRDAEGRVRGENTIKSNSDAAQQLHIVEVWDPIARTVMSVFGNVVTVTHLSDLKLNGLTGSHATVPPPSPPLLPGVASHPQQATSPLAPQPSLLNLINQKDVNIHTETLPPDNIAGLYIEGTRTMHVFAAGTLGIDCEFTVISETWTSPELKITARQILNSPGTGKITIELTSIDRSDPDPALFKAPEGYKVMDIALPAAATSSTQR